MQETMEYNIAANELEKHTEKFSESSKEKLIQKMNNRLEELQKDGHFLTGREFSPDKSFSYKRKAEAAKKAQKKLERLLRKERE